MSPLVYCSTPDCEIVVGNGKHGASKPRPCCRCSYQAMLARQNAAYKRRRAHAPA